MNTMSLSPTIRSIIRSTVREELIELLGDPDFGRQLLPAFRRRLQKSIKSRETDRVVPLERVVERLGARV